MTRDEVALILYSMGKALMEVAEGMVNAPVGDESVSVLEKELKGAAAPAPKDDAAVQENGTAVEKADTPAAPPKEEKKEIRLEDVRAVLSEISRSGHTAEMKALLAKHGAKKLSDIPKEDYEQLLAEAEEVKNA